MDAGRRARALSAEPPLLRRGPGRALATLALAALACAPAATARAAAGDPPLPPWHVGPYFGTAHNSPGGDKWGAVANRDHYFIGVRGSTDVLRWGRLSLAFAPEIVPMLVITSNPTYRTATVFRGGTAHQTEVEDGSGLVYGAGFAPLGTEALFQATPRVRAFAAIAVGVIWFTRDVPVANSKAYNYTVELGGGLLWKTGERHRLRLGYMFHHLSNAWSAVENPGLDADVFYVGWETAVGVGGR